MQKLLAVGSKHGKWGVKKEANVMDSRDGGEHSLRWDIRRNGDQGLQGFKAKVYEFCLYPKSNGIVLFNLMKYTK